MPILSRAKAVGRAVLLRLILDLVSGCERDESAQAGVPVPLNCDLALFCEGDEAAQAAFLRAV